MEAALLPQYAARRQGLAAVGYSDSLSLTPQMTWPWGVLHRAGAHLRRSNCWWISREYLADHTQRCMWEVAHPEPHGRTASESMLLPRPCCGPAHAVRCWTTTGVDDV